MSGVRNPNTDDWTIARVERLVQLKGKGYSAREIAKALGGTTRSAVIAKLHRMGMMKGDGARKLKSEFSGKKGYAEARDAGNRGKGKMLDVSPPERLAVKRFSWEAGDAQPNP